MLSARLPFDKWADIAARVSTVPRRNVNQCRSHSRSLIYDASELNTECESIPQLMLYATTESHAKKETKLTREAGEHTAIRVKLDGKEFMFGISGMRVRKKGKPNGRRSECTSIAFMNWNALFHLTRALFPKTWVEAARNHKLSSCYGRVPPNIIFTSSNFTQFRVKEVHWRVLQLIGD